MYLPVCDVNRWVACSFEWVSPAGLWNRFPSAGEWCTDGIRAVATKTAVWQPLLEVAAWHGFWALGLPFVRSVAALVATPLNGATSLFDVLFAIVQHITKADDQTCMDMLLLRGAGMDPNATDCAEAILELDCATGQIDEEEKKELAQTQNETKASTDGYQTFLRAWRDKTRTMPSVSGGSKSGGGRKGPTLGKYPSFPASMPSQAEAKQMAPPGSHVWVAWNSGAWVGHLAPFPRRSFPWQKHGHETACRLVLRHLWELWLAQQGMQTSSCPIGNLFSDSASSRGLEFASSSSSSVAAADAPPRPASAPSVPIAKAARTKPGRRAK